MRVLKLVNKKKYNTKDENLCLWRCHPERVCINCKYFFVFPEDEANARVGIYCEHMNNHWSYHPDKSGSELVINMLHARNCEDFDLKPGIEKET